MEQSGISAPRKKTGRLWKYLFFAAVLLFAAAAALSAAEWEQNRRAARRETDLTARLEEQRQVVERLESELSASRTALEESTAALEESAAALEAAEQTIGELMEHVILTPEGLVPEYTKLYPDLYAQPCEEAAPEGKLVCLTFDDGPSVNTDRILAVLDRYDVKATFFVVGATGEESQRRMRDIVAAGHTIAVHSWSHDYRKIYASVEDYLADFYRLYQWIYEVTGVYPQVFRFPGGSINGYNQALYKEIISEMLRRGFHYFDWNASAQDATVTPLDPAVITANCLKGIGREQVVLLAHDSAARGTTVQALPAVIEGYRDAGYTFAPLSPAVTPVVYGYRVTG
ncbi:MAG: polysaccharide deacetylase [Oscillospiraceae bacterium]|nr:polysaccharide deacetylase [Oscillospiraceae bacterium]